jgi:hypothetical protein
LARARRIAGLSGLDDRIPANPAADVPSAINAPVVLADLASIESYDLGACDRDYGQHDNC